MLRHTTVAYCSSVDWEGLAKSVYDSSKPYLVVAEKIASNAHVHFQGYTELTKDQYEFQFREWTADHFMRQAKAHARGVVRHKQTGETTITGFQYECKENPVEKGQVLARNMFTDEQLTELFERSEAHVKELKEGLRKFCYEQVKVSENLFEEGQEMVDAAMRYYIDQDKMAPPNLGPLLLDAMVKREPGNKRRRLWVGNRLCRGLFKD